ncbi:RNase P subunit p30 family protein [Thermogladius sp. 4427co]|uniref:RNase P subunit p30 family protein n=1 Tax=Thermogladius sp. 4427co TaxID=3450718 RepID=UPI003F7A2DB8
MEEPQLYIDLWIKTPDPVFFQEASRLGYRILASEGLKEEFGNGRIRVLRKIVLPVSTVEEARKKLAGVKKERAIVSVVPFSIEVARWVAHDRRVDSIVMTPENMDVFDKKQASIMKYYNKPVEIPFSSIINLPEESLAGFVKRLRLIILKKTQVVVSSGSRSILEIQHPKVVSSYLSALLSIPYDTAEYMISANPYKLVVKLGV